MIFVGFVYLRGTQNKYFIAYFTLILHKLYSIFYSYSA